MSYPWAHGDILNAADLNAAISMALANDGAVVGGSPPAPTMAGQIWFNSTSNQMQVWDGAAWQPLSYLPLTGGALTGGLTGTTETLTGATGLSLTPGTVTLSAAMIPTLSLAETVTGATTNANGQGLMDFNYTDTAKTNGTGPISYFKLTANNGGPNSNGGRNALATILNYSGNTANKASGLSAYQVPLYANINVTGNDGGTATTIGNCQGSFSAFNPSVIVSPAATYLNTITGAEFDIIVRAGASVSNLSHLSLVNSGQHAVRGANEDNFIMFSGASGAMTHQVGVQFGSTYSEWPFATDSTLMRCDISQDPLNVQALAFCGFDASVVTFGDSFLRSRQFTVDNNGSVQIGAGVLSAISNGIQIDSSGYRGPAETTTISGANIVNGGTGNAATNWWRDAYGGLYRAGAATGGAVTSLTVYRQPFCKGTPPTNPITLTPIGVAQGRGCTPVTINVTWTQGTTVALNPSGIVTAPTPTPGDSSTKIATTAFVASLVSGGYTPTFVFTSAYLSANQSVANATATKVQFNTIEFDNHSFYDGTTNFRFQPTIAGKYQITASLELLCSASANGAQGVAKRALLYKNGATFAQTQQLAANSNNYSDVYIVTALVDMNGSTDYVEIYASVPGTSGTAVVGGNTPKHSWFNATYVGT